MAANSNGSFVGARGRWLRLSAEFFCRATRKHYMARGVNEGMKAAKKVGDVVALVDVWVDACSWDFELTLIVV